MAGKWLARSVAGGGVAASGRCDRHAKWTRGCAVTVCGRRCAGKRRGFLHGFSLSGGHRCAFLLTQRWSDAGGRAEVGRGCGRARRWVQHGNILLAKFPSKVSPSVRPGAARDVDVPPWVGDAWLLLPFADFELSGSAAVAAAVANIRLDSVPGGEYAAATHTGQRFFFGVGVPPPRLASPLFFPRLGPQRMDASTNFAPLCVSLCRVLGQARTLACLRRGASSWASLCRR